MFEYVQASERIKNNLTLCSMADNACFGLEFYIIEGGKVSGRTEKLLRSGIELCKRLEESREQIEESKTLPTRSQLISYDLHESLESSAEHFETLKLPTDISNQTKKHRKALEKIIAGEKYQKREVRKIQDFFNSIEIPLLHMAREGLDEFSSHKKIRSVMRKE